jgi:AcrR family transcriptional regulator
MTVDARERILTAATALFTSKGTRGTSIREIAERAKVSSQLIYHYYGDKGGLVRAAVDRAGGRVHELLAAAIDHTGTARERLESFIVAWVRVSLEQGPTIRMLHSVVQEGDDALAAHVRARSSGNATLIRRLITEGIASGDFRRDVDPRFAAASVIGMVHYLAIGGPILMSAVGLRKEARLSDKLAAHTASLFLRGISA